MYIDYVLSESIRAYMYSKSSLVSRKVQCMSLIVSPFSVTFRVHYVNLERVIKMQFHSTFGYLNAKTCLLVRFYQFTNR